MRNKEGRVITASFVALQLHEKHDLIVESTIQQYEKPIAPTVEMQCYVYKDWFQGYWSQVIKEGGVDAVLRKVLPPAVIQRGTRIRQDKEPKTSKHCGGEKLAIRGWCHIDANKFNEGHHEK